MCRTHAHKQCPSIFLRLNLRLVGRNMNHRATITYQVRIHFEPLTTKLRISRRKTRSTWLLRDISRLFSGRRLLTGQFEQAKIYTRLMFLCWRADWHTSAGFPEDMYRAFIYKLVSCVYTLPTQEHSATYVHPIIHIREWTPIPPPGIASGGYFKQQLVLQLTWATHQTELSCSPPSPTAPGQEIHLRTHRIMWARSFSTPEHVFHASRKVMLFLQSGQIKSDVDNVPSSPFMSTNSERRCLESGMNTAPLCVALTTPLHTVQAQYVTVMIRCELRISGWYFIHIQYLLLDHPVPSIMGNYF